MSTVHKIAKGFELQVDSYERARPTYPDESVRFMVETLKLNNNSTVCDLGAGTGKFTRLIAPFVKKSYAVEPAENMRAKCKELLPEVEVLNGDASHIPLPNESVDALVVGQAFHWFANLESLREIHRVLRPGGGFGLIWNLEDRSIGWVAHLRDLYEQYEDDAPQYRHGNWKKAFEEDNGYLFVGAGSKHVRWNLLCNLQAIWERILSKSYISCLQEQQQNQLKQQVETMILDQLPQLKDKVQVVEYPYVTDVFCYFKQ